jgi:ATP-dependent protease ClpP protease subunit
MTYKTYMGKRGGDEDLSEMMLRAPQVLQKTYSNTVYDVYVDSEIGAPEKYRELYHAMMNAGPNDLVALHINTNGGRMDAGIQIINHIKGCVAKVVGILHSDAASMGSAIFLACDDWELNDFSTMMVHSCSYGAVGKQSDVRSRVEFTTEFNERYVRSTYTNFLTEEEILRVIQGDDIYFNSEEIAERLEGFKEARKAAKMEEDLEAVGDAVGDLLSVFEKPAVEQEEPKKPTAKKKAAKKSTTAE